MVAARGIGSGGNTTMFKDAPKDMLAPKQPPAGKVGHD